MKDETVWLTQEQMSLLFDKAKSTINEHIKNIYKENELNEIETMRKFGNSEFSSKPTNYYNLDMTISVGYRVLNPGVVIGKNTNIYPLSMIRKELKENLILKNDGTIVNKAL